MVRPDYLILGRIAKVHGVRGEVKVALHADRWTAFRGLARCWVGPSGGPLRPMEIHAEREHGRSVALKLAGVDSPEAAARLVGQEIAIPRAEAPPPPDGAFYHYDILGLDVVAGGRTLGIVRKILETPAHDVYVIDGAAGEWLLPATRVHIRRIDVGAGRIELDPATDPAVLTAGGQARGTGSESI
ncbi:MAG: 16S rRNA processing protein RimM [candidate division NC10 bacterium RBG_16_65_8]|nr:MAG: 16S rRNA processing protein RimM [candidate division NC10 bacterium RBG_16_65_8]